MLMMLVLPLVWSADARARSGALFVLVWPGHGQLMLWMLVWPLSFVKNWPQPGQLMLMMFFLALSLFWPGPGQLMLMMLVLALYLFQFGCGLAS